MDARLVEVSSRCQTGYILFPSDGSIDLGSSGCHLYVVRGPSIQHDEGGQRRLQATMFVGMDQCKEFRSRKVSELSCVQYGRPHSGMRVKKTVCRLQLACYRVLRRVKAGERIERGRRKRIQTSSFIAAWCCTAVRLHPLNSDFGSR